jgi:seryl-tRNA synthetase
MCESCPSLLDRLFAKGVLHATGVDGLYARSGYFESVISGLDMLISRFGADNRSEAMHFPPGMSRALFEKSGYMNSFPQLSGTIHSFAGDERDHFALLDKIHNGESWTKEQVATDIVLTPAACYPLYPLVAKRGPVRADGLLFDVQSYCFRHEPSRDSTRMQMFRMREFVRIGTQDQVTAFREIWLERGRAFACELALPHEIDAANDPFFGRGGRVMASSQRELGLKFELVVPIESGEKPTACMSFNYHQDHFASLWGIELTSGEAAHTACIGFGMERLALALFRRHGLDIGDWPPSVRAALEF